MPKYTPRTSSSKLNQILRRTKQLRTMPDMHTTWAQNCLAQIDAFSNMLLDHIKKKARKNKEN